MDNILTQFSVRESLSTRARNYLSLTKPEVNLLVLMTMSAAYYLGAGKHWTVGGLVIALMGTLLVSSGTATLNQWMERRWDSMMRRTASRPLPSGKLSARAALIFGMGLSLIGVVILLVAANQLSAVLAATALASYLLIYTPLKRKTPLCTMLGAVPGAMPVLIGWAAAAGTLSPTAWKLFGIVFLWQFPHFLAIAISYREDYARAGFKMLPAADRDAVFTKFEIVAFTVALIVLTILPIGDSPTVLCAVGMLTSGAYLMYYVLKLCSSATRSSASRLIHASIIYLPVVLVIMVAKKIV